MSEEGSTTQLYTLALTELSLLRRIERTRRSRDVTTFHSRTLNNVRLLMASLEKKLDKQKKEFHAKNINDDRCYQDFKLNSSYEKCAVCIEDFQEGERCRILEQCKHVFHPNCIYVWLKKKPVCPICRCSTSV